MDTPTDHPLPDHDARIGHAPAPRGGRAAHGLARSTRRPCSREVVGADALIIRTGGVIDAALLDCGENLKVVGRHGVGYDQIDVEAATERGIQVVYTPGANTAERLRARLRDDDRPLEALPADDVGAGRGQLPRPDQHDRPRHLRPDARHHRLRPDRPAGRRDRPARASACTSSINDIVARARRGRGRAGARRVGFDELLGASEYVTLHVPLDASTRGMIDREALALMRPDAILINACRGPGRRRGGGRRGARRRQALGLRRRRLRGRAARRRPPPDRPPRRHAHPPQRRADRRGPEEHGDLDRRGRPRRPPRRAAAQPGQRPRRRSSASRRAARARSRSDPANAANRSRLRSVSTAARRSGRAWATCRAWRPRRALACPGPCSGTRRRPRASDSRRSRRATLPSGVRTT